MTMHMSSVRLFLGTSALTVLLAGSACVKTTPAPAATATSPKAQPAAGAEFAKPVQAVAQQAQPQPQPPAKALQPEDTLPPAPEGKAWALVWSDEFEGTSLDMTKWDIPEYKRRDAWWSRKAVELDGKSNLVMKTFKEGDQYYDACVRTKNKFEHAFGYYVARIQLQKQPGHWSAFWLYNDCVGKVGNDGRDGTEIDIMEKPWLDDRVQNTLHWDGYGKDHKSEGKVPTVPGVMQGYHTFSLLWTPDEYVFYTDGKETWRTKAGGVCQVPLYIKLSDEAQLKGWAGDLTKAQLPDQFLVDYVRVYDLVERK